MDLPQDMLVEFFLRLHTFHLRRVACLVCHEWRAAHMVMQRTHGRAARYGQFQFAVDMPANAESLDFVVSQSLHGPMVKSIVGSFVKVQGGGMFVGQLIPLFYLSYMNANGILAHPWTWVAKDLWFKSMSNEVMRDVLCIGDEGFGFGITVTERNGYWVRADNISVHYPDFDISRSISETVVHVIRFAIAHCIQETWRCTKLEELISDYPYGMLEHIHAYWEPCLRLRTGDVTSGKLGWRE